MWNLIIGGAISFLGGIVANWIFQIPATRQLKDESAQLRRLVNLLAGSLKEAGAIDADFKNGELVSFTQTIHAASIPSGAEVGHPRITLSSPNREEES